ncbi:MAG: hypothetical protein ABIQ26_03900, partial [Streptosporangiaceae bacterium]
DSTKYITLAKGEPIPLHFSAVTATCTCEFVIDLDLRSAGHDERLTIDDRGAPFRASSLARRYGREFVFVNMGGGMRSVPPKERKAT